MKQKKKVKFFERKECKNNKTITAFKGYASFCNVEILNCFNPERQLEDSESAIKNKLTD